MFLANLKLRFSYGSFAVKTHVIPGIEIFIPKKKY